MPNREQIAVLATLDIIGIAFTVAAAVALIATDENSAWWWTVVGLAAALGVATTVCLVRLIVRRQMFRARATQLAGRLESGSASPELVAFARVLRADALASGEARIAALLDAQLEPYERRQAVPTRHPAGPAS